MFYQEPRVLLFMETLVRNFAKSASKFVCRPNFLSLHHPFCGCIVNRADMFCDKCHRLSEVFLWYFYGISVGFLMFRYLDS